ncbi:choice-of-anchor J domain-containing protein [Nonlabens sp. Asnod2-A12]|uniref:choice-of-anchor J domain-containing protein n=1 Tax=Nonlabens sp. Asnod2-A12 TaxID=3160578 RepID=UPI00386CC471
MKIKLLLVLLLSTLISTAQFTEGFESAIPATWTVINNGGANGWIQESGPNGGAQEGTAVASIEYNSSSHDDYLITPSINVVSNVNDRMSFYVKSRSSTFLESYEVLLSTTGVTDTDFTVVLQSSQIASNSWTQLEFNLSPYIGQTVYVALRATGTDEFQLFADNFVNDGNPTCVEPSILNAASITAISANLGWTAAGSETLWDVEYGADGFTQGTGTTVAANSNPYTLNTLTESTDYDYYVRANCGGGDVSAWAGPFSFSTPASCLIPTALDAANITSSSAELSWASGGSGESSWEIEYGIDGFTQGAGTTITPATNPVSTTGLMSNTDYDYYVRANCGAGDFSEWVGPFSFTTLCAAEIPDFLEDFSSYIPSCWVEAVDGDPVNGPSSLGSSKWAEEEFAHLSSSGNGGVNINIYQTDDIEWLLSPQFDLSAGGYEINLDVAFTNYNATTQGVFDADDDVRLLYTLDGVTWTTIVQWNAANGNTPAAAGETFNADLSAITGSNVQFAIYSDEGATASGDKDFHIDNFQVRTIPSCQEPTVLTASNITATSAYLGWTVSGSAETMWDVEYGVAGFTQGGVASTIIDNTSNNPYNASGLTESADYDFYVRAHCGVGNESAWAGPFSFSTPASCLIPTALSAANITATSADLSWTSGGSGEASWEIEYGVDGFTQGAGNVITPATNPYNLNVLTSNTAYDYYVRANCGGGDFSEWVGPYSFTTPCVAFNIPFTENFDSSTTGSSSNTNAPDCWSFIDSGSGYVYIYDNSATNVQSGDKSYRFYNGFDSSGDYMLISPKIAELTTDGVQVQFSAKGTSSGQELELGTITDPNDASTFTVLVTATLTSSSFENIEINIPTSTDSYFAVRHGQTSTLDSYYLDDFSFNALPSCVPPTALSAANITATSVDLSWTSGGSGEASWEIEHGTDGFTQGAGTIVTPATNPYNLTGLIANTTYDYYVRANCGAGDYSEWVGPYSFETSCESKVPGYVENFDSYVPDCWEEATGELDASLNIGSSSWASDGFANNGTTGAARYNMYTTTTGQWLISPPIDLGIGNSNQLKFDISATDYASSTFAASFGVDDIVNVVISTDNGATWSTSNVLQTWTQGTTPSVAGDAISIDLSAYSGLVKVGFVAKASSSIASDWDLFIDNFEVNAGSQDYIWNGTSWNNTPEGNITSNDNMIIQSGSMPSLTGAISVNDLTIETGASLEVDNGNITVSGDLVNNGTISGSNEVVFIGAAEVITGTGTMNNLTVGSTGAIVVAGQQSILEQLDVISGGSLSVDASGDLTLVSNAMGTARVDAVDAGSITGNVNVERYIPAGNRAFRFLGSTVSGASVFDSWQEAGNNSAGFGVQVTGTAGTVGTVNINGHDETATGNQSLFKWDNSLQSWSGVANTKTEILNAGDFYRVFVRGDRMNDLSASNPSSTETTLRATGTLMTGPMTVTPGTSMGEFFALSNPYQSKLSMSVATTAGVAADMYYWDPNVGPRGTYSTISISGGVGTIGNATNVLEPGQAVFFADSGTGASITLAESDKVGGNNNVNVFRATPLQQALRLKIYQTSRFNNNETASDGLYIDFDTAHNLNLDLNDAVKLNGLNVNMAIAKATGELLSVERRTLPDANEVVGLNVTNYLTTAYTFNATLDILPGVTVYLKDTFTGVITEIVQGRSTAVDFTVDLNDAQSINAARFEIVFQRSTLGNDDHLFTNSINVYPNPVNGDLIYISLGSLTEEKVQVTLFNTLGQQVISRDFNSNSNNTIRLDRLSSLESGLYILNISNGMETVTRKIILN